MSQGANGEDFNDIIEGTRGEDKRSFIDRFQQLPYLFSQACVYNAGRNRLKSTLQTISDMQANRQTNAEAPKLQDEKDPENVAVLLLWILGEKQEAEERAARAVQKHPRQLLALSNWAYILWHNEKTEEAKRYLTTIEQLKGSGPSVFDDLDYEAQSELLYLYIKLGHSFKPFVVSEFQERLLAKRPQDSRMKFTLALTLRRYNQRECTAAYPKVDFTKALRRATNLFMEIKNDQNNSLDLRGKAAAELGEIVSMDEDEKKRLGLSPRTCYEEAIRLAPNNCFVLNRAGKFFRFQKDLNKSRELLERAISVLPDPKAHNQLALTFREIALQQANRNRGPGIGRGHGGKVERGIGGDHFRGDVWSSGRGSDSKNWRDDRRDSDARDRGRDNFYQERGSYHQASSSGGYGRKDLQQPPHISRDNKNVQKAIVHFRKSLEIQHGDNMPALQGLGLILLDIGNYQEALEQFVIIAETWPAQVYYMRQAFEHAGKALQAIRGGSDNHVYRETSMICYTLGLAMQCLSFFSGIESDSTTLNPTLWASLGALTTSLSQDEIFFRNLKQCGRDEKILLKSLRNHLRTVPALTTLSGLGNVQADRDEPILEKIQELQARGDNAGALLLRSLLNMTLKYDDRFHTTQEEIKSILKTAQWLANLHYDQRQRGSNEGNEELINTISRIISAASHVLCRQAFQDAISLIKNSTSSKAMSGIASTLEDFTLCGASEINQSQQVEEMAGNLHVLFLYDPRDQEAKRDVSAMEKLLESVCGLKISRLSGPAEISREEAEVVTGRVCDDRAVDNSAELRAFIVRSEEMSPEYNSLIQKVTKAGNSRGESDAHFMALPPLRPSCVLLLNGAPLPEILSGHRLVSTWKIPPEVAISLSGSGSRPSSEEIDAAYNLLGLLFGLTEMDD